MGTKLGDAKRARKLARLFERWRRAFDAQDHAVAKSARQAIDTAAKPGRGRSSDARR